jgi:uncharacterized protein (TIGR03663 family)
VKTRALAVASILAVAAFLRLPHLADRPMHADEAVLAHKLGTLLETGDWTYDPRDYHGPVLHYLTAASLMLGGIGSYAALTEIALRVIPALSGVAVVLIPLLLVSKLGWPQALAASALTAISPAMVYYSRYYIPEMLLTCLSGLLIAAGRRYLAAGLLLGLMFTTKETAVIVAGCLLLAYARGSATPSEPRPSGSGYAHFRNLALTLAIAVAVAILLLGFKETIQAIAAYAGRAVDSDRHVHPWHYYLRLLLWSEAAIIVLAAASLRLSGFARFLVIYTLSLLTVYSLIPYKTPWCLIGVLQGMTLLAGVGYIQLARRFRRVAALAALLAGTQLGIQAFLISRQYAADPRNPYAYAHTSRDIFAVRNRLEKLGRNISIQVISPQNVWPLPWYLRPFPHVEWRRDIGADMRPAPVILATPDVEPALLHRLYEVPPPGQRPLYGNLFPEYTELRPGVELRGYAEQSLLASATLASLSSDPKTHSPPNGSATNALR